MLGAPERLPLGDNRMLSGKAMACNRVEKMGR